MSIDLTTQYGTLTLKSPIVVGACPLTAEEMLRIAMVSAGAGAIVLPSLFEEQVILWNEHQGNGLDSNHVSTPHEAHVLNRAHRFPITAICESADHYLQMVSRVRSQLSIPVIASLNGECSNHWLDFASALQSAGASAIELHVRQPPPSEYTSPREIEEAIVETAQRIREVIDIPLFLKLGRNYTSISHLASRLQWHTQGLVLFGHSPQADINLDSLQVTTSWGLTVAGSITKSLASIIRVHEYCPELSIAASGGIGSSSDFIKVLMAGANVAMITSAIYRDGPTVIGTLLEGLIQFMEQQHLRSIAELRNILPSKYDTDQDRLSYIKAFSSPIEPSHTRCANRVIEGDPWGHPRSPR